MTLFSGINIFIINKLASYSLLIFYVLMKLFRLHYSILAKQVQYVIHVIEIISSSHMLTFNPVTHSFEKKMRDFDSISK